MSETMFCAECNEWFAGSDQLAIHRRDVHKEPIPPTLASLWGIAPDLTGGVDSTSYIRRQRDGS